MFLRALLMLCLVWLAGVVSAAEGSVVTQWAEKQEAQIAERVGRERTAMRRVQMEYLARQDYALRMEREQTRLIRGGKLTTPEVEALRAQRQALVAQIQALDEQIAEASLKAPEILELQALGKANEERLAVLREAILPISTPQPPAEEAPAQEAVSQ